VRPPNTARFLFLDPRARTFYAEWEKVIFPVALEMLKADH